MKKNKFVYLSQTEAGLISHGTLRSLPVSCYRRSACLLYFSSQHRISQWTSHVTAAELLKTQPGLFKENSVLCIFVLCEAHILSDTHTPCLS